MILGFQCGSRPGFVASARWLDKVKELVVHACGLGTGMGWCYCYLGHLEVVR